MKMFQGAILVCCVILAGCSNLPQSEISAGQAVLTATRGIFGGGDTPPKPTVTRAQFASVTDPLILVTFETPDALATIVRVGVNGANETYQGADGVSLTTNNGVVIASRGYSDDLMHADVRGLLAALRTGQGSYDKSLSYLDGLDQLRRLDLQCTLSTQGREVISILGKTHATRKMDETCVGAEGPIISTYWVENGRVVKSRQKIAPSISWLVMEQIK